MNVMSPPPPGSTALPLAAGDAEAALACICEIAGSLARAQPLPRAVTGVLGILSGTLGLEHGLVTLRDDAGALCPLAACNGTPDAARNAAERVGEGMLNEIMSTGLPVVARAAARCGSEKLVRIGVPLKDRGRTFGTLTVERQRHPGMGGHCDDDVRLLTLVGTLLAQTLRSAEVLPEMAGDGPAVEAPAGRRLTARDLGIIGASAELAAALRKVARVAATGLTVLLRGESGTGKELFAHAVHRLSPRAGGPFVRVNCTALPETMLESELFGHERGAFTGALSARKGRFELADGGTLFLDEIGDVSLSFQAKLLRVLQEGEFERVGGSRTLKVDVRIVTATNRDLEAAVTRGSFRADLYYRLGVVPVTLPALRERPGDIPVLARFFLQKFNAENRMRLQFATEALDLVRACPFPGNVRELENCIQRTAVLAPGPEIVPADFACKGEGCSAALLAQSFGVAAPDKAGRHWSRPAAAALGMAIESPALQAGDGAATARDGVKDIIATATEAGRGSRCAPSRAGCGASHNRLPDPAVLVEAMEEAGWVKAKAARLLHLTPRQVAYALSRHHIEVRKL